MTTRRPRLILMVGLPGAGKTTLASRLAAELPALRLSPDEWLAALGHDLRDPAARDRVEALQWQLAQELLALGQRVILENGFWSRAERDAVRARARAMGAAVEIRFLDVPVDELGRRLGARSTSTPPIAITPEELAGWVAAFEAPDEAELALFDPPG